MRQCLHNLLSLRITIIDSGLTIGLGSANSVDVEHIQRVSILQSIENSSVLVTIHAVCQDRLNFKSHRQMRLMNLSSIFVIMH